MVSKLKVYLSLAVLLLVCSARAQALTDFDNSTGRYDGHYKCKIMVIKPHEKVHDEYDSSLDLEGKYVTLNAKEGEIRCRYDQVTDYGYKTEIEARHPKENIRYRCTVEGSIVP
jgi:hypothetical protein